MKTHFSWLPEIAFVLVRLNHVASFIVNVDHCSALLDHSTHSLDMVEIIKHPLRLLNEREYGLCRL
jgi:hypothetical protein